MTMKSSNEASVIIKPGDSPNEIRKKIKQISQMTAGRKINCHWINYDKSKRIVTMPLAPNLSLIVRQVNECRVDIDKGYYEMTPAFGILIDPEKRLIDSGSAKEFDEHVETGVSIFVEELDVELKVL
jgi:hypothetical protein